MARGSEGIRIFTGNEDRIKQTGLDSTELIKKLEPLADQAVISHQLVTALAGEGFFIKVKELSNGDALLGLTKEMLKEAPFIRKFIPDHLEDDPDAQAAYIIAVARKMNDLRQTMN